MPSDTLHVIESIEPALLSPLEGIFWRLEDSLVGAYRVTVLFQLEGAVHAHFLAPALNRLQLRHPKLRSTVIKESDGTLRFHFAQVPPQIPFEIIDYEQVELPWREGTRRLMQAAFPARGPLAAVTVLRDLSRNSSVLLITVHHAIADGLSAIMLVDDLLTEYAQAETCADGPLRPSLPPVTALRARRIRGLMPRLRLFRRFLRIQRKERSMRQTSLPEATGISPQSQWEHWIFPADTTLKLVRRCRKEQTSVGAALIAAVCCSLMECLPISEGLFKCHFPFDVRENLEGSAGPVTSQDLGCFASIMNCFLEVQRQPSFWDLARRAHRDIQEFVQNGGPSACYNLAAAVSGRLFLTAAPRLMPKNQERVTLLATNYGVLNMRDAYGSLRPRGCTLMFKNDEIGPSLVMEALVFGQKLNVGLAADGLDPALWSQLHGAVRKQLEIAAEFAG